MQYFVASGYSISSVGLIDTPVKYIFQIFMFGFKFSSNIRSNFIFCLFFPVSGVVLFNGLGRMRGNFCFRYLIGLFTIVNFNKKFIFQNFADYRYYRLFFSKHVLWVPGSGGVSRSVGDHEGLTVVSRPEKWELISASVFRFCKFYPNFSIHVVGCSQDDISVDFNLDNLFFHGYLPQSDILMNAIGYLSPSGYGEGVPHGLVDSICSSCSPIFLSRQDYIRYGFYKLGYADSDSTGEFRCINSASLQPYLSSSSINTSYFNYIVES